MLKNATTFLGFSTDDLDASRKFYSNVLGLEVLTDAMGVLKIKTAGSNHFIIYPKPDHEPAKYTVLNFEVKNIENQVDALAANGVTFLQYNEPIQTDEKGICRNSGGPLIAWFKDNAGNILSLIQED